MPTLETSDVNKFIFRAYDIRGLVETELTPRVARLVGRAYGGHISARGGSRVVVGMDNRLSSPELHRAFIEGVMQAGVNVADVGVTTTPALYFAVAHLDFDGGVNITGSHNPPAYNGIKLTGAGAVPLTPEEIQGLLGRIQRNEWTSPAAPGVLSSLDNSPAYMDALASGNRLARPLRVAVDAGNGVASTIGPEILRRIGCDVHALHCVSDGTYPNHIPDPEMEENVQDLEELVLSDGCDAGIAFDGDADRVGLIDERGGFHHGDELLLLLARDLLDRHPGSTVLMDLKSSQAVANDITGHGGRPVFWKSGHSLMKAKMRQDGILLGGEVSGHMFFAENYIGVDDGVLAACRVLRYVAATPGPLSAHFESLVRTFVTPELRLPCPDAEKVEVVRVVAAELRSRFDAIELDGIRLTFDDGWALVRPSNTSPYLTVRVEAQTPARLIELLDILAHELDKSGLVDMRELHKARESLT